jgi:hypothetical protein
MRAVSRLYERSITIERPVVEGEREAERERVRIEHVDAAVGAECNVLREPDVTGDSRLEQPASADRSFVGRSVRAAHLVRHHREGYLRRGTSVR